jgi:hypothetical protein
VISNDPKKITKSVFDTIAPYYEEYVRFGGFPRVVLETNLLQKKKILEEIFSSFYQIVALQLGNHRSGTIIRELMLFLLNRIGSGLNIQKVSKELGISRPSLYRYLSFLEGAHFISVIRPFSLGRTSEIRNMPKVYVCDSGFLGLFSKVDNGCMFQNSIFQSLRRKGKVNYYHRKSGVKIDFIINRESAYDVRINPHESNIRKLNSLTYKLGCNNYRIVSKTYSTLENVTYGFML